jgi:hypothetical protein
MDLDFSPLGTDCTPITGTENRGISGAQLKRLRNFLMSHANTGGWLNGWIDLTPAEYSPTSGLRLNVNTINLYQVLTHHLLQSWFHPECVCKVTAWIIKPSTMPFSCRCAGQQYESLSVSVLVPCSFVELLCEEGTEEATPSWFCSHWQAHPYLHELA